MATITALSISENVTLNGVIRGSSNGSAQNVQSGAASGNGTVLPSLVYTPSFGNSAASGQINTFYADQRTLAANATDNLKLSNVSNPVYGVFGFSNITRILVALNTTPAANTVLYVGPQGNASAAPLCWGNTTATSYNVVYQKFDNSYPIGGWPIANTTADVLPIHNAGNTSITYAVWVWGTQAGT